jgi:hypothetical protein
MRMLRRPSRRRERPASEDRIRSLEDYQRDLERRAAEIADQIKTLKEGPRSAT